MNDRHSCSRRSPSPGPPSPPWPRTGAATDGLARRARHAGACRARWRARGLLNGLARAGKRIVAVGQRGHIAATPTTPARAGSRPTCRSAPTWSRCSSRRRAGWAVGHDGVVLHTADAGRTWTRQLDGRRLGDVWSPTTRKSGDDREWLAERGPALRGAGRREPVPRRLVPTTPERLVRRRLRPRPAHRATAARPGSRIMHAIDNPKGCTSMRCAAWAAVYIAGEQGCLPARPRRRAFHDAGAALQGHAVRRVRRGSGGRPSLGLSDGPYYGPERDTMTRHAGQPPTVHSGSGNSRR